nr:dynein regulatory complex protein 11-like [Vulpes vulpes]
MSNAMYNKMWHQTQEALNSLLDKESQNMMESQRNQVFIFQMLATFYIKYVQIFRNLEDVYDQIVHPQKRILIRKILDGVMGRVLELKNEMVELELTEFHYFDDILQDLKLAPQQLDIPIPKYFLKEKLEVIKGREKILAQILTSTGLDIPKKKYSMKSIPLEEAVKLIQISERARQGRLRAMFMKQIFLREHRAKQAKTLGEKVADVGAAALQIQKVWRGFHQCKKTEKQREEEMIFLGMNPPPLFNEVSATVIQAEKVASLRNEMQIKHEMNYKEALVTIKDDLKLLEGPDIKENLQDQIRHWFIECRNLTGMFPEYPNVEEGGSAIIFSNKTPQQVTEDIIATQEEEEKNKKKKKKKKAKKPKKPKKEKEKKETKEKNKEEDEGWKMSPSVFIPMMEEGNNVYKGWCRRIWEGNVLPICPG